MTNILKDYKFENGFNLKGLSSVIDGHEPIRSYKFNENTPSWYLCQWNSKYNLNNQDFNKSDKGYQISDESKNFIANKDKLIFELKASKEFEADRIEGEGWPHLLLEQDIDNIKVQDMKNFILKCNFELCYIKSLLKEKNNPLHTVQFVWVTVLKNINPLSADYNHFMWVVICLYDYRYDFSPLYCAQDVALDNGEFIYCFDSREFMKSKVVEGENYEINFDIYPNLPEMLKKAQRNNFLKNTNLEDLALVSTNFGFEITGILDAKVKLTNIGIYTK